MSNSITPSMATTIMPLRNPSPVSRDWAAMGLPEYGWVLIKEEKLCRACGVEGTGVCVNACISNHALPEENRQAMGTCSQCDPAPCAEVCPTGAVARNAQGVLEIDQELCIGCRFCEDECPSHALMFVDPYRTAPPDYPLAGYTSGQPTGLLPNTVAKCTFCSERLQNGMLTVCAESCPSHAVWVGNLDRDTATNGQQVVRLSDLLKQRFEAMGPGRRVLMLG